MGDRFFPKNQKEILADAATGKAVLVIYKTGKWGKYISIYDPLRLFASPTITLEPHIEDPNESYEREKKSRQTPKGLDVQEIINYTFSSDVEEV